MAVLECEALWATFCFVARLMGVARINDWLFLASDEAPLEELHQWSMLTLGFPTSLDKQDCQTLLLFFRLFVRLRIIFTDGNQQLMFHSAVFCNWFGEYPVTFLNWSFWFSILFVFWQYVNHTKTHFQKAPNENFWRVFSDLKNFLNKATKVWTINNCSFSFIIVSADNNLWNRKIIWQRISCFKKLLLKAWFNNLWTAGKI